MYEVQIKNKVLKFVKTLENKEDIQYKLKQLEFFKSNVKLDLDIKRLKGQKKNLDFYRLRIGEVRFIFQVLKNSRIILVRIANFRGSIYT